MFLPKTENDLKVFSILSLLNIVMHVIYWTIFFLTTIIIKYPQWLAHTFWMWYNSLWLSIIGAIIFINKYYKLSAIIIVYIGTGLFIPVLWCIMTLLGYTSYTNESVVSKFIIVTITVLYIVFYFYLLGLYTIIDTSFTIRPLITVFSIVVCLLLELWSIAAWIVLKDFLWFFHVNCFLLVSGINIFLYRKWSGDDYKFPEPTFYIFIVIGLFLFVVGCVIYFITRCKTLLYFELYSIFIMLVFSYPFRSFHYKNLKAQMGCSEEVTTKDIFPVFVYDSRKSILKNISKDKYQGMATGMLFCLWAHTCTLLSSPVIFPYWIIFAAVFQDFTLLYQQFMVNNALLLHKELFENINLNDIVKCMNGAIGTLENTEGHLRSTYSSPQSLLKALRLFYNIFQWEKIKQQQSAELGLLGSKPINKEEIDLSNEADQELIAAYNNLEIISGSEIEYFKKLRNFNRITQIANEKTFNLKALAASFTIQISLYRLIAAEKISTEYKKEEEKLSSLNIRNLESNPEANRIVAKRNNASSRPQGIPDNVQYDPNSFFDRTFSKHEFSDSCTWIRVKDISPKEKELALFSDDCEGYIEQGSLNDCWVIAAIAILESESPQVIRDIFITKEIQESGKYYLKLFSFDEIKTIELDDYFPCYTFTHNPKCCRVLIDHRNNKKVIWPLLLEKAIAKEYGSYENLNGGAIDYALMMMTGKPSFRYNFLNEEIQLSIADNSFWLKIRDFAQKGFLLGGGTLPEEEIPADYRNIAGRHAYAILDALELDGNKLLLLKDPRGVSEWVGEWSVGSNRWTSRLQVMTLQRLSQVNSRSPNRRRAIELFFEKHEQNIFFMSWKEFIKCFEVIFVSVSLEDWNEIQIRDEWKEGCAGSSTINNKGILKSPQYLLKIPEEMEVFCLLIHLIEPSIKTLPRIGFEIHKYNGKLIGEFGAISDLVAIGRYSAERAISLNCVLDKGDYLVLITTYETNQYGHFSFRMWYPKEVKLRANTKLELVKVEA